MRTFSCPPRPPSLPPRHLPRHFADFALAPPPIHVRYTDEIGACLVAVRVAACLKALPVVRGALGEVLVNVFPLLLTTFTIAIAATTSQSRNL